MTDAVKFRNRRYSPDEENADFQYFALSFSAGLFQWSALRARRFLTMKKETKKTVIKDAIMAMLTALSVVLVSTIHIPLIPAAPFLEYDPADIPILIGSLILGPIPGVIILIAVCIIQAMTVSASSGIIGFLMHFIASSVLILIPSVIYRKKQTIPSLIIGLVLGTLAMTVVMIPLNLLFTGIFLGAGVETVGKMLIPAIIPFNLIKAAINSAITFAVFTPISGVLKKYLKH